MTSAPEPQSPEVAAALDRIKREWDIQASKYEPGFWRSLRHPIHTFQLFSLLFAFPYATWVLIYWSVRSQSNYVPEWLTRWAPNPWWLIILVVFGAPEFAEDVLFRRATAVLQAYRLLPPSQTVTPPISLLKLRRLGLAQTLCRIVNSAVHVTALAVAIGFGLFALSEFVHVSDHTLLVVIAAGVVLAVFAAWAINDRLKQLLLHHEQRGKEVRKALRRISDRLGHVHARLGHIHARLGRNQAPYENLNPAESEIEEEWEEEERER